MNMKMDWRKMEELIPAIIQNGATGKVLMLGYMNQEALQKTQDTKKVWLYSRSKQRLWMKGEISGNELSVKNIETDCDNDALVITAQPTGPTCHTGEISCFGKYSETILEELQSIIQQRKKMLPENSYTASLFNKGYEQIASKVLEEAEEVVAAGRSESDERVAEETADVIYHMMVLLAQRNIPLEDVFAVLNERNG